MAEDIQKLVDKMEQVQNEGFAIEVGGPFVDASEEDMKEYVDRAKDTKTNLVNVSEAASATKKQWTNVVADLLKRKD